LTATHRLFGHRMVPVAVGRRQNVSIFRKPQLSVPWLFDIPFFFLLSHH